MKTLMQTSIVILSFLLCFSSLAQLLPYTSPSISESILLTEVGGPSPLPDSNMFQITPLALSDSDAVFMHLWWSGDNGFSFAPQPVHNHLRSAWNQNDTIFKMTAIPTENYGTGGPPPLTYNFTTEHEGLSIPKVLDNNTSLHVQTYRNAVIRDTMYLIVTYGNSSLVSINGKLIIDVGDHARILDNILLENPHYFPNGEDWLPNDNELTFENLGTNEERSILIPVKIKNNRQDFLEMQVYSYREGVTENSGVQGKDYFKITPAVARSHDPNMMIAESDAEYKCDYRGGKIHYTVKFQNDGEGTTDYVRIECYLDDKLDLDSITGITVPKRFYKSCRKDTNIRMEYVSAGGAIWDIDRDTRILTIEMHDITLYSSIDPNLPRIDLARGQIEFDILVNDDYKFGKPVISHSEIFFDTNEAIVTNDAETGCRRQEVQSFICKYIWWFAGGLLALILLIILLIRKKKKRQNASK